MRQGEDPAAAHSGNNTLNSPADIFNQKNDTHREQSPLDLFFKADREEKARARSASSTQNTVGVTGPFHPPISPRNSQTPPAASNLSNQRYGLASRSSSSGVFSFEPDSPNTPDSVYGPAFSTPYSERINAARAATIPSKSPGKSIASDPLDRSELLKAYLFSGAQTQANTFPNDQSINGQGRPLYHNSLGKDTQIPSHTPRVNGRSSGLRQEVTPTKTPTRSSGHNTPLGAASSTSNVSGGASPVTTRPFDQSRTHATRPFPVAYDVSTGERTTVDRSADLRGMEDSLRRILKLDSA